MLKDFENKLVERYKNYLFYYDLNKCNPNSWTAGHLQEISWILHELFGYTDKDIRKIEAEAKTEIERNRH